MIPTKAKSHRRLGEYLAAYYLPDAPRRYIQAFLLGCTEPDKNPSTYLKGSIRSQWMRGHNWGNAQRYMTRIANRLEKRNKLLLADYYTMGKLIHYTTDAFTSAHNEEFGASLSDHRSYEADLQDHFLAYLSQNPQFWTDAENPVMDTIRSYPRDYIRRPTNIHTDSRFAIIVCCMVMARLFAQAS